MVNQASVERIAQIDFADTPDMQRIGWGCFGTINQVPTFSCSSKGKVLIEVVHLVTYGERTGFVIGSFGS